MYEMYQKIVQKVLSEDWCPEVYSQIIFVVKVREWQSSKFAGACWSYRHADWKIVIEVLSAACCMTSQSLYNLKIHYVVDASMDMKWQTSEIPKHLSFNIPCVYSIYKAARANLLHQMEVCWYLFSKSNKILFISSRTDLIPFYCALSATEHYTSATLSSKSPYTCPCTSLDIFVRNYLGQIQVCKHISWNTCRTFSEVVLEHSRQQLEFLLDR